MFSLCMSEIPPPYRRAEWGLGNEEYLKDEKVINGGTGAGNR